MEKHHAFWWAIIVVAGLFTGLYGVELLELSQGTQLQLSSGSDSLTGFAVSEGMTGYAALETESVLDLTNKLTQVKFEYVNNIWNPSAGLFKVGENLLLVGVQHGKSTTGIKATILVYNYPDYQKAAETNGQLKELWKGEFEMSAGQPVLVPISAEEAAAFYISNPLYDSRLKKTGSFTLNAQIVVPIDLSDALAHRTSEISVGQLIYLQWGTGTAKTNVLLVPMLDTKGNVVFSYLTQPPAGKGDKKSGITKAGSFDKQIDDSIGTNLKAVLSWIAKKQGEKFDLTFWIYNPSGKPALAEEETAEESTHEIPAVPTPVLGGACPVSLSSYDVNKDGAVDEKDLQNFVAANPTLTDKAGVCTTCPVCKVCPESGEAAPAEVSEEEAEAITAHSPSITIDAAKSIPAGTKYTFTVEATDEDGDAVTEITAVAKGKGGAHDVTFKVGFIQKTANVYKATVTWDKAVQGAYTVTVTAKSGGKGAAITSKELSNTNTFELTVVASGSKAGGTVKINIPGIAVAIPFLPKVETASSSSVGRSKVVPGESSEGEPAMVLVIKPTLGTGNVGPITTCNTLADCKKNEKCKGKWIPDTKEKPQTGGGYCIWSGHPEDKLSVIERKGLCDSNKTCIAKDGQCKSLKTEYGGLVCGTNNEWVIKTVEGTTPKTTFSPPSVVKVDLGNEATDGWLHIGDNYQANFNDPKYTLPSSSTGSAAGTYSLNFKLPYRIGDNYEVFFQAKDISASSSYNTEVNLFTDNHEIISNLYEQIGSKKEGEVGYVLSYFDKNKLEYTVNEKKVFYDLTKESILRFNMGKEGNNYDDLEIKDIYVKTGIIYDGRIYFGDKGLVNMKKSVSPFTKLMTTTVISPITTINFYSGISPTASDKVKLRFFVYGIDSGKDDYYNTKFKMNNKEYVLNNPYSLKTTYTEETFSTGVAACHVFFPKDLTIVDITIKPEDIQKGENTLVITAGKKTTAGKIEVDNFIIDRIEVVVNEKYNNKYDIMDSSISFKRGPCLDHPDYS